ncbi:hypothetical protein [Paenibacillus sp. SN-8-1]|uniref:hypothetical protein n=1 Tax=Paenibacillus sp. SN-8-1 TaxID=3435409 RepID=UPI003D9A2F77
MELFWYSLGIGVTGFIFAVFLRLTAGARLNKKYADIIAILSSGVIALSFAIFVFAKSLE